MQDTPRSYIDVFSAVLALPNEKIEADLEEAQERSIISS